MDRRTFLVGTGAVLLATPLAAEAQPATRVRRVGIYSDATLTGPLGPEYLEAFRNGLRDHGWVEGRNVAIDFRESRTIEERPEAVASLLRTKPEVLVTSPVGAFVIRPSASQPVPGWSPVRDIPIVFVGQSDPVGIGLVESLPRPGGSVTGLSYLGVELNSKRLQQLKELIPTLSRVAVLVPSDHLMRDHMVSDIEAAARVLGVNLQLAEVAATDPVEKIDAAFEAMARGRAQAVLGLQGPLYYRERKRVCDLALRHQLPGSFELTEYTKAGCLMSYATSPTDLWRRSASYVDKILKGAKPADLPVEQPTKFELVINLKTAKALGLTIPPALLGRADEVIQ
jgi:putative ABC transport system substrate-binding protein